MISMRPFFARLLSAAAVAAATVSPAAAEDVFRGHGLAMHGNLKYPADFTHFDYVNPAAPKGGSLRIGGSGGFDSLNPFIIRGQAPATLRLIYDTLMVSSADEPFSMYGLVAESVEVPEDRSSVTFHLHPDARFHDGEPITADDVIFSFNTLLEKGSPFYGAYYGSVAKVERLDRLTVRFTFKQGENRELPLILGQLEVLPEHYWRDRNFEQPTLDPPLASGPYRIGSVDPGRRLVLERVEDYWAKDLPAQRGQYNFDRVIVDFYRDDTVAREALKAGDLDYRSENNSKAWATDYDVPSVRSGGLIKRTFEHERNAGMQAFIFNTRRGIFKDRRVREAIGYAFDFQWTNENLFHGQYTRTDSYFANSELASRGLPDGEELKILERYRGRVPEEVFTTAFEPPVYDGSGSIRPGQRKAIALLEEAGWVIRDMKLVNAETGRELSFEVMLWQPGFDRIVLPFVRNLRKRLGIKARVRLVDAAQFQNRIRDFDFDMFVGGWGQSLSPGNEQRDFWSSEAADIKGSRNVAGIKDPVIDELVELVIAASDRESLVARTRALDRVLLWHYFVVPNWYIAYDRLVYWDKFGMPDVIPTRGTQLFTWWVEPEKELALSRRQTAAASD